MEPTSTGAGGFAAFKLAAAFGLVAMLSAIIGFLIVPPKSEREFVARSLCTVICSFVFGPVLAIAVVGWMPGMAEAARWVAHNSGAGADEGLLSILYILMPCALIAGLPAWWVLGAATRWVAKMPEEGLPVWWAQFRKVFLGKGDGA
jgi:zinc transporter ZupT